MASLEIDRRTAISGLLTLTTGAVSAGGGTERASDVSARSLFVVAEGDDERFVETTRTLRENAPEPTRLKALSSDDHGQRSFETDRGDELETWIDDLIETACAEG